MPSLRELQSGLQSALLDATPPWLADLVEPDGLAAEARLAIYRHHVLTTLTDVLAGVYPAIRRLVDARFFAYAADAFIRACPPSSPVLSEYGPGFADFLADFPPCRPLGYLADVARLEWALHAARHAPAFVPLELTALAALGPAELERVTFTLDPSLTVLASPWPIDRIWRAQQPDAGPEPVDLDGGGAQLEIRRAADDVVFHSLSPAAWALRRALADGRCLADGVAAATAVEPAFELVPALRALFEAQVLETFHLPVDTRSDEP
jgi:hypothetical protein